MKIAIYHNLPSGGAKRALYEWTSRLSKKHLIDVYTLSGADHDFCDIRPFTDHHRVYEFSPYDLFGSPFGRLNNLQRWRDLERIIKLAKQIANDINAGDYDIIFANTCIYTFIPIILNYVEKPSVYYLHEPFGRNFKREINRPYLKINHWRKLLDKIDPLIQIYERRLSILQENVVLLTDLLLANSQYTQEYIKNEFNVKAPICVYGVDTVNFHPIPGLKKGQHLISVGELSPRKGFDFIIESLRYIPEDKRPVLRLACNRVDERERIYIESLALNHGVKLEILTSLTTGELNIQYNKASLCVYTPVQEPFGLVPLEAMACGTAVIGVREGGVVESIVHGETGLLIKRDPIKFSKAVENMLSQPELIHKYGNNGRLRVLQNWTWEKSYERIVDHFYKLV